MLTSKLTCAIINTYNEEKGNTKKAIFKILNCSLSTIETIATIK